jgi:hypothetical protein
VLKLYQVRDRYDQHGVTPTPQSNAHRLAILKAISLLEARGEFVAAALLKRQVFQVRRTGDWECETYALIGTVPLATYEELRAFSKGQDGQQAFREIVSTLRELEVFVTFFALDLDIEAVDASIDSNFSRRLVPREILPQFGSREGPEALRGHDA